jgi:hypothetical protein
MWLAQASQTTTLTRWQSPWDGSPRTLPGVHPVRSSGPPILTHQRARRWLHCAPLERFKAGASLPRRSAAAAGYSPTPDDTLLAVLDPLLAPSDTGAVADGATKPWSQVPRKRLLRVAGESSQSDRPKRPPFARANPEPVSGLDRPRWQRLRSWRSCRSRSPWPVPSPPATMLDPERGAKA